MATTPEGKVKQQVKALLKEYDEVYSNWPVPMGYGEPTLDCIGCYLGFFFAIETKAPGGKPTPRQLYIIDEMTAAQAAVFVIDGEAGLMELRQWLEGTRMLVAKIVRDRRDAT